MAKKWISETPVICEMCSKHLVGVFIDGKTRLGPWAIMCATCHEQVGYGLGLGKGQKYSLTTLEKLEG
jgi:hypothetical protein